MEKCLEPVDAKPSTAWTAGRWRKLAEDVLLLAAFALTSSWLLTR
jgi:hypothetical protein